MTYHLLHKSIHAFFISLLIISSFFIQVHDANASTSRAKPTIVLTAPKAKGIFAKEGSGIIPIAWSAKNVPENTFIILELDEKKLAKGSTLGGGIWQKEIPAGNSSSTYNWDIEGEGRSDPGTYRIRALLQECVSGDCTQKSGTKKTKIYAKSKWVNITIAKSAANESSEASKTIGTRSTGAVGVSLTMNGNSGDSLQLSPTSEPVFYYYPTGDVESCKITAYYQGGDETENHGWKNGVKAGDYGRATFSAVREYPFKALESVEVVCGNAKNRATDTMQFTVDVSAQSADFKIMTGKTGRTTYKKGNASRTEAESYCKQAYNDPEIHKYTRVQCYFDGERFEDVKAFKG